MHGVDLEDARCGLRLDGKVALRRGVARVQYKGSSGVRAAMRTERRREPVGCGGHVLVTAEKPLSKSVEPTLARCRGDLLKAGLVEVARFKAAICRSWEARTRSAAFQLRRTGALGQSGKVSSPRAIGLISSSSSGGQCATSLGPARLRSEGPRRAVVIPVQETGLSGAGPLLQRALSGLLRTSSRRESLPPGSGLTYVPFLDRNRAARAA